MDQDRFEAEVVALAAEGVKLTVANVAARTSLPLRRVEEMLDAMVAIHRLDSEVDEAQGFVFYRVRGLDPSAARTRLAILEREIQDDPAPAALARRPLIRGYVVGAEPQKDKSVVAGILLAALFGPLGLLYAGPFEEVALAFMGFLAVSFATILPLIGRVADALIPFAWLASIALQIVYVARFNANGQRTGLLTYKGSKGLGRFRR
jgi:hypothetical protein